MIVLDFHTTRWQENSQKAADEFIYGLDNEYQYRPLGKKCVEDFARAAAELVRSNNSSEGLDALYFESREKGFLKCIQDNDDVNFAWILKIDFSFHMWKKHFGSAFESAVQCLRLSKNGSGRNKRFQNILQIFNEHSQNQYAKTLIRLKEMKELEYTSLSVREFSEKPSLELFPLMSIVDHNETVNFDKIQSLFLKEEREQNFNKTGIWESNSEREARLEFEFEERLEAQRKSNLEIHGHFLTDKQFKTLKHEESLLAQKEKNFAEIGERITDVVRARNERNRLLESEVETAVFFNPESVSEEQIRRIRVNRWETLLADGENLHRILTSIITILDREDITITFRRRLRKYSLESNQFDEYSEYYNSIKSKIL